MQNQPFHLVFSGGGTAGHLFPGLAVADRLTALLPRARITFCGSGKPFERRHVLRAGFDYLALPARPLPRGAREAVAFVVENLAGYMAAGRFLREEQVAAVIGLGGYASVPMARAAARRRVPLILLEQNAIPGKATRWLAQHAALVCTAFEETGQWLRGYAPIRVTGNPIRADFAPARTEKDMPDVARVPKTAQLLVLGGSGGARALNENVPRALYKVRGQMANWRIVHQTGEADAKATQRLYEKLDLPATVVPFLNDVPQLLAETDLAVCRAGGTTLAELAVHGVPAILLPYPHAADDHQAANAGCFAGGGGCVMIEEGAGQGRLDDQLADMLCFLLANKELRGRMADAMHALARPHAAEDVAELIWSVLSSRALPAELATA
jgi:UDP-N-acetylglucosamine--N-acetylmuramyl-(pentapeptide) pyrophosphoryl-undecaprenol N-acetylglucosamine transferase